MYRLIIEDDEGRQSVVPVSRTEITIGRREGNTIRLNERNVSRVHARLSEDEGYLLLQDAGSRYGVKVNGQRVVDSARLSPGDDLTIGDYHLSMMREEGPMLICRPSADGPPGAMAELARKPTANDLASAGPLPLVRFPGRAEDPALLPRLLLEVPGASPQEAVLWSMRTSIGRTTENDLAIVHPSVRRRHALLLCDGDQVRIQSLDSNDVVRVNGQGVRRSTLANGDQIELGSICLEFRTPSAAPAAHPTALLGPPPSLGPPEPEAVTAAIERPVRRQGPSIALGLVGALGIVALAVYLLFPWSHEHTNRPPSPVAGLTPAGALTPGSGAPPVAAAPSARTADGSSAGVAASGTASPPSAAAPTPAAGSTATAPPVRMTAPQLAAELALARQELGQRQWDAALATLGRALDGGGGGAELEALFLRSRSEKASSQQLVRAREMAADQNDEAAFLAARSVPPSSVYRPEADQLAQKLIGRVIKLHLERGRHLLRSGDASGALTEYQAALSLEPTNKRAQAGEKLALSVRGASGRPAAVTTVAAAGERPGAARPAGAAAVAPSGAAVGGPGPAPYRAPGPASPASPPPFVAGGTSTPSTPASQLPSSSAARAAVLPPPSLPVAATATEPANRPLTRREEAVQLFEKGRLLQMKGKVDEAERVLRQSAELMPGFADPHLSLALIYARQRQKDRALAELRQFLLIAPNDPRRSKVEGMMKAIASSQ